MSNGKNVEFTKDCVARALFLLLEKQPYEKISISDIAKKAGIGRATFYRHFMTKEDVVRYYFEMETRDFMESASQVPNDTDDYYENIFTAFSQLKREKRAFQCLLAAHMEAFYFDYMNKMMAAAFSQEVQSEFRYLPYHYAGSLCNLSLEWVRRDCKESVKTMADEYVKLLFPDPAQAHRLCPQSDVQDA